MLPAITIDRPRNFQKTFRTPAGEHVVTYPVDYGYFDDFVSPEDGEGLDVFKGSGGKLYGRFMKGKETPDGWAPDEHKYFAELTDSDFDNVLKMYRQDRANLLRDIRFFPNDSAMLQDIQRFVAATKKAAVDQSLFKPDFTPDQLKAMGVYDELYAGTKPQLASLRTWPKHWLHADDPNGWAEWYEKHSLGRRHEDDDRQIKRWYSMKRRHLAQYRNKPTPRRAMALRNWGIDAPRYLEDPELEARARADMERYAEMKRNGELGKVVAVPWSVAKAANQSTLRRTLQDYRQDHRLMWFSDEPTTHGIRAKFAASLGLKPFEGVDDVWFAGEDDTELLDSAGAVITLSMQKEAAVAVSVRTELQRLTGATE